MIECVPATVFSSCSRSGSGRLLPNLEGAAPLQSNDPEELWSGQTVHGAEDPGRDQSRHKGSGRERWYVKRLQRFTFKY